MTNTRATSLPFAAAGPAVRSFDKEDVTFAEVPTWDVIASIGGIRNAREFVPEPHLHHAMNELLNLQDT